MTSSRKPSLAALLLMLELDRYQFQGHNQPDMIVEAHTPALAVCRVYQLPAITPCGHLPSTGELKDVQAYFRTLPMSMFGFEGNETTGSKVGEAYHFNAYLEVHLPDNLGLIVASKVEDDNPSLSMQPSQV